MAHRRSSLKKIRSDKTRREVRLRVITDLKTSLRKMKEALASKKHEDAEKQSRSLFSKLDKAVRKGILHDNSAARKKSRISLRINALKPQGAKK